MSRKQWTKNEIDSMVQESLRLVNTRGLGPGDAMLKAQDMLPLHKQLAKTTAKSLGSWSQELFIAAVRAGLVPLHHIRAERLRTIYPSRFVVSEQAPVKQSPQQPSVDGVLRSLFQDFEDRIVERVAQRVLQLLDLSTKPDESSSVVISIPPKATKKVLVVGLLGQQISSLDQWFKRIDKPQKFEWVFTGITPDDTGVKKLVAACKASDLAIMMSKFTSHSVQSHMKKHCKNFQICNGSTTNAGKMIEHFMQSFAED